ncbi:MAG: phosphate regulon sensor histidine kinase PhoR [Gammaproteobacteria bacterium]|nr:phosphate regulon sensor histidine kinase PhoR [Gammaproteobacteria bacterium]
MALVIGGVSGHYFAALLVAALLYIAWLHRNLGALLAFLRNTQDHTVPEPPGVLEDIALEIDYLRERHKKRKKKLASYLQQFQQATRALPDATVVLSEDGAVRWANEAAARHLGVRWPEDLGQRITNLIRLPKVRDFITEHVHASAIEIPSPTDANRFLSVLLAPYGKNQFLFVARDITDLHRANQIRSDFVANVSHELRTPITVFRGYLETLVDQREQAPVAWQPALDQLNAHANRMQTLVEELLLLSRLEQEDHVDDPEPVLVSEILGEVLKMARDISANREHFFSLEVDPQLEILGSRFELTSAISNLVFNAVNYTSARGVIQLRWYQNDEGAHLEVQDNGIGIDNEDLERITERFYRVDSSRSRGQGGTGLGLAIVKHVLVRHGATLTIKSELGEGSTFRCDFPLTAIAPQAVLALSQPA